VNSNEDTWENNYSIYSVRKTNIEYLLESKQTIPLL